MAILKNTTISDTGYLRLPVGTTAERPSSPDNGMIRYNVNNSVLEYWNGSDWVSITDTSNFIPAFTKYTYNVASDITSISGSDANGNTLSYTTDGNTQLEVFVNGVKLVTTTDYTATNGTSISFTYTIPSGSVIDIQVYSLLSASTIQSQWTTSGSNIYYNTGNVGIGGTPTVSLDVGGRTDAIRIPVGTTAQRPSSPADGMIRYNTDITALEYYSATAATWVGINDVFSATGGSVTTYASGGVTYKVHTFTSSGSFTVASGVKSVEVLIVAGGGGGGNGNPSYDGNGGGGAGGLINSTYSVTPKTYSIVVGAGGGGGAVGSNAGVNGGSSVFDTLTAIGGGGGGTDAGGGTAVGSGGSGGGASCAGTYSGIRAGGSGTAGQGFAGGGAYNGAGPGGGGGGGGGATSVGATGQGSNTVGGNGGSGYTTSITGSSVSYAGGGGGSSWTSSGGAGQARGGNGGSRVGSGYGYNASSASANSGSGGGAGTAGYSSGNGGSGIVIIRYAI